MDDIDFDRALVRAAFELAAGRGWSRVTVAEAARHGGLPLDRARARFIGRNAILLRFGRFADMAALAGVTAAAEPGAERDMLFDMIMRRIDVLQAHRDGVQALFRYLPVDAPLALLLTMATKRSMAWLLEGAGIPTTGPLGTLRVKGLLGVWLWTVRTWQRDETAEMSETMATLDKALRRAEQAAAMLPGGRRAAPPTEPEASSAPFMPDDPGAPADDAPLI